VRVGAMPFKGLFTAARGERVAPWLAQIRPTAGRFFVYRFDARARTAAAPAQKKDKGVGPESHHVEPTLALPPLPAGIRDGRFYLVAEIVFHLGAREKPALNWKMLVELHSGAILRLRALTSGVNGLVFTYDPKTSTGNLGNTPTQANAVLNPLRDDVLLPNLDPPAAGVQSLAGSHVTLADDDTPAVAAPTVAAGSDFDYDARTDNFAAVNAYYHANNVFDVIEDLGFDLGTYFDGTAFPVHVDHRASFNTVNGVEINAFCNGDAQSNGIGLVGYCLSDDTNTTDPLGRSVDRWVHWHEIGGHGILWDHVDSPNFGFAHSAGDALAAFQNDPESQLRALPERFQYAPFRTWPAGSDRWFNRDVAAGWGWGGVNDTGLANAGYRSEQIVATTLFRVYQALGGDSTDVDKRWQASRVATYLVLQAVGHLAPGANANSALDFYNALVAADTDDWTSEGWAGGAYNKLIRWAFERQGLFQPPGAATPTTQPGAPPAVDLYIDDGRGGEYTYLAAHWNNTSVWNRRTADGLAGHESAVEGADNYVYVRIRNRGSSDASGTVRVYHCLPGAGLTWPTDFTQATPVAGLPTGNVLANNGNDVVVGPFTWQPNRNVYGHDCLLAIVSADGDPSNVDNLEPGQTIQEWRLVPHDNNVGQRNVTVVAGGGGGEALATDLHGAVFFAGNNFGRPARFDVRVELPRALLGRGWRVGPAGGGASFQLRPGEKRRIELQVERGADFTADEVRALGDRSVRVTLYGNGVVVGGMTYLLDPDIVRPTRTLPAPRDCRGPAAALLDCLQIPGRKVKKVRVRKVSVDIELRDDGDCD
jgi:zinc metalloprotease ZmpB